MKSTSFCLVLFIQSALPLLITDSLSSVADSNRCPDHLQGLGSREAFNLNQNLLNSSHFFRGFNFIIYLWPERSYKFWLLQTQGHTITEANRENIEEKWENKAEPTANVEIFPLCKGTSMPDVCLGLRQSLQDRCWKERNAHVLRIKI